MIDYSKIMSLLIPVSLGLLLMKRFPNKFLIGFLKILLLKNMK